MTGMAAWGSMIASWRAGPASPASGPGRLEPPAAHHAAARPAYFRAKIITGYAMAGLTIVLLYLAGLAPRGAPHRRPVGAHDRPHPRRPRPLRRARHPPRPPAHGRLAGPGHGRDLGRVRPLRRGLGPDASEGVMHTFAQALPSYWLVQAGKTALDGTGWPAEGWIVVAVLDGRAGAAERRLPAWTSQYEGSASASERTPRLAIGPQAPPRKAKTADPAHRRAHRVDGEQVPEERCPAPRTGSARRGARAVMRQPTGRR